QRLARARSDATCRHISAVYRKSHTGWQHRAALNGGVTISEPARTTTGRTRIRWIRVAGLIVVIAAITAGLGTRHPASSFSTTVSRTHILRGEHGGAPGEVDGAVLRSQHGGALGETDGAVPVGTTVFDDGIPGVARLNADLLSALRRAATDAAADRVQFYVDSGWRSWEYQQRLLGEAISKYGSEAEATRWVATPNTSAHVKGDAVDIGPSDAAAWLSKHGAAYGLCQIYANER